MDTRRLCAAIFERSGIAVDEHDPIVADDDAKLRVGMRASLAQLHQRLGVTTVYVTHDQTEAMTLGQRVAVMRDGKILQCDRPQALYARPDKEGKAGLHLAELGVAQLLAKCSGRRSWRIKDGYCIPVTPQGLPDGFRVSESRGSRGEGA